MSTTPPTLSIARRIHELVVREREAIYNELLAEAKARHELQARVIAAATAVFDDLSAELGGQWERRNGSVELRVSELDLRAGVSVGKDDRPCVVVHLGTAGKAAWIEADAENIVNAILGCITDLVRDPKWQQEARTQLRGAAQAVASRPAGKRHDLVAPAGAGPNGRVALPLAPPH